MSDGHVATELAGRGYSTDDAYGMAADNHHAAVTIDRLGEQLLIGFA